MPRKKKKTDKKKKSKSGKTLEPSVYDIGGERKGKVKLPKEIFDVSASDKLIAQYVRVYLANKRQGGASTKKRGEVRGSTRKIYRQKGTGRARHGDIRAPIFVGGGIVHGPQPRDYSLKLNKKQKRKALFSALSQRLKEDKLVFIDGLTKIKPKTKNAIDFLKKLKLEESKNLLIYPKKKSKNLILAFRNLGNVKYKEATLVNAYDVLAASKIIFLKEAVADFLASKGRGKKNENR